VKATEATNMTWVCVSMSVPTCIPFGRKGIRGVGIVMSGRKTTTESMMVTTRLVNSEPSRKPKLSHVCYLSSRDVGKL
jgi:hypothetical protein